MSLTLYYHPLSSFCWKVLSALYENDTPFTPKVINMGDADDRAAFLKLWPVGKFPVLRDEQRQRTIPESSIIIEYLDQHFSGTTRFIPDEPDLGLRTRLRDRFLDLYLHMPTQTIVFDRLRPSDARDPLGVAEARARLRTSYAMLEAELPSAGWAMGERFTLADCAAVPALFYAEKVEPFGGELSVVPAYLERLKARPSVARVLAEAEPYFHMFPREPG
ncbi:putative Glutathione S-transferase [Bradyrhizobium sp. ORS 285]|uniref:glutathione S-transferase family protein n=1 Tax=Bradyrhizobium sp. ORS 285 TaxID=115808 RepID=UPI00024084DD|nr:glutathione S-transferase family protein [Bradyrhizobium sp. ORS 285]CCD89149.1 putative Glutathione S-transferase [Bradyrhizobium sp. ORS 285]SMX55976.1 putative Glutathione S-transferase [Bradyrhizobium sp. ORS 285]